MKKKKINSLLWTLTTLAATSLCKWRKLKFLFEYNSSTNRCGQSLQNWTQQSLTVFLRKIKDGVTNKNEISNVHECAKNLVADENLDDVS